MSGAGVSSGPPRAEVPVLLAGSLLLFVALATFTLLAYRAGTRALAEERRDECRRLLLVALEEVHRPGPIDLGSLARRLPPGVAVALLSAEGHEATSLGFDAPASLDPVELAGLEREGLRLTGPDVGGSFAVRGLALVGSGGNRRVLRLDLPSVELARQLGIARLLTPAVIGLSIAAAVLLLIVSRQLVRPLDAMIESARRAGLADADAPDATAELVAGFERALAAWTATREGSPTPLGEALGGEASSGVALLSPEGTVLAVNLAARRLLVLGDGAIGLPAERAFAEHPNLVRIVREAVASEAGVPRGTFRVADGAEEVDLGLVIDVLKRDGALRGFLLLVADITEIERRAAGERLEESLARLGELSAGVAHEMRNSVATVAGYIELARRTDDPGRVHELLEEAGTECRQMTRVVADFLGFARPELRVVDQVDLAALVREATRDPSLGTARVRFVPPPDMALLRGDPDLLAQVCRNLLRNAAEATDRAGTDAPIDVLIEVRTGSLQLRIEDRGAGLPAGAPERLFEPFVSERPGGVGLGLALCRRIVLLHGGSIALAPRPGGGTVVSVEVPTGIPVTQSSA